MRYTTPNEITSNGGIEIETDLETPVYLVDNEGLMIHTRESLWETYKDSNLYEPSDSWNEFPEGEHSLIEILESYEDGIADAFFATVGMTYGNENFLIQRIL